MNDVKSGKYQHYKGKLYLVLGIAHHSETDEELVLYQELYKDGKYGPNAFWVRPKDMFLEKVLIDGKKIPRFEFIGDK